MECNDRRARRSLIAAAVAWAALAIYHLIVVLGEAGSPLPAWLHWTFAGFAALLAASYVSTVLRRKRGQAR